MDDGWALAPPGLSLPGLREMVLEDNGTMATIVFDADGVLWDGIVLYGDPVTLRPGIKEVLKELTKRKHTLVCCSKNDLQHLCGVLKEHGLLEYFEPGGIYAAFDTPKSELFRQFLGDDPTLFIDDDPFQRAEVRFAHPRVEAEFYPDPLDVLNHPFVAKAETEEDIKRVTLLREQRAREVAEQGYSKNFQLFLHESRLVLSIYDPIRPEQEARALDLLNRTNELKTTQKRYECLPAVGDIITAALTDRFGDYGLIAVAHLAGLPGLHYFLNDLAVSCRTQGRGVGSAMVVYLCREYARKARVPLFGEVEKTDKNWRMQPLFEYLGFTKTDPYWTWHPATNALVEYPTWLTLRINPPDRP